ncbi:MAG: pyruvate dehydrogenase (acetyl-transferring), homodimeric type, partial [Myxococcota bacterium]
HRIAEADSDAELRVQLLGSGAILRDVLSAADILKNDFNVSADVWSVTSFTELRRDGLDTERWNMLHPGAERKRSFVESCLESGVGPVIATSDYMKVHAEQIRPFIPGDDTSYTTLGTDGYGRSDSRKRLRHFFEVSDHFVVIATLKALADRGDIPIATVQTAMKKYGIDPEKPNPVSE